MVHVFAVLGLAVGCGLWFMLQRHAPPGCDHSGSCGACHGHGGAGEHGSCSRRYGD